MKKKELRKELMQLKERVAILEQRALTVPADPYPYTHYKPYPHFDFLKTSTGDSSASLIIPQGN